MGVVYRAEHLRLGRKVVLKLLPPELAANEGFRERFQSESRLPATIDHPNIIPLYDAGEVEVLLFLTMRFVDGFDLKALLERDGPMALERAVSIVAQIGGALDAAHARDLVHRDVKPANVLVASGAGAGEGTRGPLCVLHRDGVRGASADGGSPAASRSLSPRPPQAQAVRRARPQDDCVPR